MIDWLRSEGRIKLTGGPNVARGSEVADLWVRVNLCPNLIISLTIGWIFLDIHCIPHPSRFLGTATGFDQSFLLIMVQEFSSVCKGAFPHRQFFSLLLAGICIFILFVLICFTARFTSSMVISSAISSPRVASPWVLFLLVFSRSPLVSPCTERFWSFLSIPLVYYICSIWYELSFFRSYLF